MSITFWIGIAIIALLLVVLAAIALVLTHRVKREIRSSRVFRRNCSCVHAGVSPENDPTTHNEADDQSGSSPLSGRHGSACDNEVSRLRNGVRFGDVGLEALIFPANVCGSRIRISSHCFKAEES